MIRIIIQSILIFLSISLNGQTCLSQNFESSVFPPEEWTIEEHTENWKMAAANYAGGTTGGAKLQIAPVFNGTTRLISPEIDVTNSEILSLYFKHTLRLYQSGVVIGVAIRSGSGDWETVWEMEGTTTKKAGVDIVLEIQGNANDFQFCFYFTGESGVIKYWAIDNVLLYDKKDHDIATKSIITDAYFEPEDEFTPLAKIYNNGLNTESFDVVCNIFDSGNDLLYTDIQTIEVLNSAEYIELEFTSFTLPATPDEAYHIVVSANLNGDMDTENDTIENIFIHMYLMTTK